MSNNHRPPTRARGTVEFQGGPLDGLEVVVAHLEKVACTIEIVLLESGEHMMRRLIDVTEWGARLSGHYRFSPRSEGGSGDYHWQAGAERPDQIGAVRWQ